MEPLTAVTTATVIRFKRGYKVMFMRQPALSESFKALENRRFDKENDLWGWVVSADGLYVVMMAWRGKPELAWEFKPAELKEEFRQQALLIRDRRREAEAKRESITGLNQRAVALKEQLLADRSYELTVPAGIVRPDTPIKLYYHQQIAAAWLLYRQGGILAAEMGLGKTYVFALVAAILRGESGKALIVAPKSLVLGIIADLEKLLPDPWYFLGYEGKQPYKPEQATVFLASYSYFARTHFDPAKHLVPFGLERPAVVVLDESHLVKNHGSLTFKNINDSFGGRSKFICSTGTPIKSWGREIWTQLHLIDPWTFDSRTRFERDYCGAYFDPWFKRIAYDPAQEQRQALHALLQPYMFRVRKEDVLDLPPKIYRKLVIPLSKAERKAYDQQRDAVREELLATGNEAVALTLIGKLRQYCAAQKIDYLRQLIDSHVEEGEKVVLVDQFKFSVAQFAAIYADRAVVHTGEQDIDERRAAVQRFQAHSEPGHPDGADVFLGTTDTCKYGLTLTAARILYLMTLPWTPAECDQVYDRCHRISQSRSVLIFIPVLEGTIDEYVYDTLETKRATLLEIIDNQGYAGDMKTSIFDQVLKYLKKGK